MVHLRVKPYGIYSLYDKDKCEDDINANFAINFDFNLLNFVDMKLQMQSPMLKLWNFNYKIIPRNSHAFMSKAFYVQTRVDTIND